MEIGCKGVRFEANGVDLRDELSRADVSNFSNLGAGLQTDASERSESLALGFEPAFPMGTYEM